MVRAPGWITSSSSREIDLEIKRIATLAEERQTDLDDCREIDLEIKRIATIAFLESSIEYAGREIDLEIKRIATERFRMILPK